MLTRFRCFSTWAMPIFAPNSLSFPIVSFKTAKETTQNITLDSSVFNVPIRKDLIHNVFHYYRCLNWQTTHRTKRYSEIAGSGIKPRPQKGSGQARLGFKQANTMRGGGKAHGPVPRDHSFKLNRKVILLGLKTILSARLAEGNIIFVDSLISDITKTREMEPIINQYGERTIMIHDENYPENFKLSTRSLKGFTTFTHKSIRLNDLVLNQKILITVDGAKALQENIKRSEGMLFRNKKLNRKLREESKAAEDIEPVVIKTKMLKEIVKKYELDIPTN